MFTLLVRRHGPMVLGLCRRLLGHEQDAEDAFQATFLILARKAGSIRQTDVGGFLYRVAYHLAVLRPWQCGETSRCREPSGTDRRPRSAGGAYLDGPHDGGERCEVRVLWMRNCSVCRSAVFGAGAVLSGRQDAGGGGAARRL